MSTCNIDHSLEDVTKKLASQADFLPTDLYLKCEEFLLVNFNLSQNALNEMFHLFKKYDLISTEEQLERNKQLWALMTN